MADYKYIVFEKGNQEFPVIFAGNLVHSNVSEAIRAMVAMEALSMMPEAMRDHPLVKRDLLAATQPVSAGFINFEPVMCFGRSETLSLDARPDDMALVRSFPYSHGLKL